jgi:hypothetical protein
VSYSLSGRNATSTVVITSAGFPSIVIGLYT